MLHHLPPYVRAVAPEEASVTDDFVVGPGVRQAIEAAGDAARSDEQFIILAEGSKISQTFARDAIYYWMEADNATKRCPF